MNDTYQGSVLAQEQSVLATNKVLRNTYMLLSMTLFFSAAMAGISMFLKLPIAISIGCSLGALALVWFALPRTVNSNAGIYVVFGFTGLLGLGLGPILNHYIAAFSNGGTIIMLSMGMTGSIFFGLSAYVLNSRKDFSFMRSFLVGGMIVAIVAMLGLWIASFFGVNIQPMALAFSAMVAMLMCGFILYDTSSIIHGGETNYVRATASMYLSIYNLFTSLLHLLGFGLGED